MRSISKKQVEGVKRLNINIPFSVHNRFKAATAARGENMTDVVLELIEEYVNKQESSQKKGRRG